MFEIHSLLRVCFGMVSAKLSFVPRIEGTSTISKLLCLEVNSLLLVGRSTARIFLGLTHVLILFDFKTAFCDWNIKHIAFGDVACWTKVMHVLYCIQEHPTRLVSLHSKLYGELIMIVAKIWLYMWLSSSSVAFKSICASDCSLIVFVHCKLPNHVPTMWMLSGVVSQMDEYWLVKKCGLFLFANDALSL